MENAEWKMQNETKHKEAHMRVASLLLAGAFTLAASPNPGQEPAPKPLDTKAYDEQVRPFLVKHCMECHGTEKPKGKFHLDRLSSDFADDAGRQRWQTVVKRVKAGEMPPKAKPRPSEQEIQALSDWISASANAADARKAAEGRVVLRRLNRVEYENTVRDLLGVEVDLKDLLPQDTSAHGFDNNGEALHTSSFLMERYLEAADAALNVAIVNGPKPPVTKKRYSYKDEHGIKSAGDIYRKLDDAVVFFSSTYSPTVLGNFYPQIRGKYRFRISAYGFQNPDKPVTFRVRAGGMMMAQKNHLIGYFDAPADKPIVVEFVDRMEPTHTLDIVPYGTGTEHAVRKEGADKYKGAGLAVQWVEVEGPLNDTWPPESHRRLFGDLAQEPVPGNRDRLEVVSKDPEADAERILRAFVRRAYRRTATDEDIKPFLDLVKQKLAAKRSFEQAVRVGLKAIMVSPEFLFRREKIGGTSRATAGENKLDDFALASRLSYFLWSTMPDEELFTLAAEKKLRDAGALRRQVERMLTDPKAAAFTENFLGQWLSMRDIDFTSPDTRLYPEFDDMLKAAMVEETHKFFDELLKNDLSLTNLVASDFTFLNERLAKHYGIPGVEGHSMRKVTLPAESHRGGIMTMASVLKVTANGTTTSPVVRGAWVLDRVLGTPPSPPPSGVAAVEPDIRGATTIREQLAKHRQIASCAACHSKIDPPGFALENFDVIGGWRDNYRSVGNGKPVKVDGRTMPYFQGPNVDPADVLPDGRKFKDIDELKQLLLKDKDQLARALAAQLLTYATGAAPTKADEVEIEAIVKKLRDKDYGLRTLVHEIIQSKLFQNK
jgi:mono/diheme cytochrome c family protein